MDVTGLWHGVVIFSVIGFFSYWFASEIVIGHTLVQRPKNMIEEQFHAIGQARCYTLATSHENDAA